MSACDEMKCIDEGHFLGLFYHMYLSGDGYGRPHTYNILVAYYVVVVKCILNIRGEDMRKVVRDPPIQSPSS